MVDENNIWDLLPGTDVVTQDEDEENQEQEEIEATEVEEAPIIEEVESDADILLNKIWENLDKDEKDIINIEEEKESKPQIIDERSQSGVVQSTIPTTTLPTKIGNIAMEKEMTTEEELDAVFNPTPPKETNFYKETEEKVEAVNEVMEQPVLNQYGTLDVEATTNKVNEIIETVPPLVGYDITKQELGDLQTTIPPFFISDDEELDTTQYYTPNREALDYIKNLIIAEDFSKFETWDEFVENSQTVLRTAIQNDPVIQAAFKLAQSRIKKESEGLRGYQFMREAQENGELDTPEGLLASQARLDKWAQDRYNELFYTPEVESRVGQYKFLAQAALKELYKPFGRTKEEELAQLDEDYFKEGKYLQWKLRDAWAGTKVSVSKMVKQLQTTFSRPDMHQRDTIRNFFNDNKELLEKSGILNLTTAQLREKMADKEYWATLTDVEKSAFQKAYSYASVSARYHDVTVNWLGRTPTPKDSKTKEILGKYTINQLLKGAEDYKGFEQYDKEATKDIFKLSLEIMQDEHFESLLNELETGEGWGGLQELGFIDTAANFIKQLPQMGPMIGGGILERVGKGIKGPWGAGMQITGKGLTLLGAGTIMATEMTSMVYETMKKNIINREGEGHQITVEDIIAELEDPESIDMIYMLMASGAIAGLEKLGIDAIFGAYATGGRTLASLYRGELYKFIKGVGRTYVAAEIAGASEAVTEGFQGYISDATVRLQTGEGWYEALTGAKFDWEGARVGRAIGQVLPVVGKFGAQTALEINQMALDVIEKFDMHKLAPTMHATATFFTQANDRISKLVENGKITKEEGRIQKDQLSELRNAGLRIPQNIDGRTRPRLIRLLLEQDSLEKKIKEVNNKDISSPEIERLKIVSEEISGIALDAAAKTEYLRMVGNVKDAINGKVSGKLKYITAKDKKGVEKQIDRLKKDGWNLDKKSSSNYGSFFHNPKTGKQIIILNQAEALKDGAVNTAAHEFLHAVIYNTVKNSKGTALALGNNLLQYLEKINPDLMKNGDFANRVRQYQGDPTISDEVAAEEVLTLFSEAVLDGALVLNEGTLTQIGDFFRRIWQSLGFGNIRFDTGEDIYKFIKDYNKNISRGKTRWLRGSESGVLSKAQERLLDEGAEGDLVKRKYRMPRGKEDKAPVIIKPSVKKLTELTKEFKDGNFDNVEDLTKQYQATGRDALKRWAGQRGVPINLSNPQVNEEVTSLLNKEFNSFTKNFDPSKAEASTYMENIAKRIGPKIVEEATRKGKQVSQDVLTEKGRELQAEETQETTDKEFEKRKYPTDIAVIEKQTADVRPEILTNIKNSVKQFIASSVGKVKEIGGKGKKIITKLDPSSLAKELKAQNTATRIAVRNAMGKSVKAQNDFIKKAINDGYIETIPIAAMKKRFRTVKGFNIEKIGRETLGAGTGIYQLSGLNKQALIDFYTKDQSGRRSFIDLLAKGLTIEQFQEVKIDTEFMNDLAFKLKEAKSELTAEEFMNEVERIYDGRTKEFASLDIVKASKKRKPTPTQDTELRVLSTKHDIYAAQRQLDPKGKIIKPNSLVNIQKIHKRDLETVLNGDIGTAVLELSNFGNFGRRDRKGKGLDKDGNPIRVKKVKGKWPPGTKKYFQLMDGSWVEAGTTAADLKGINRGKFMPKTGAYYGKSDPAYEQLIKAAKENDNSPLNQKLLALKPKRIKIPKGKKIDKAFLAKHADQIAENQKALRLYTKILEQSGQPLSSVAPFITASYQATTGLIKISAGFKGASKRFEHGKGQKYSKGEKYREEHSPPASVIGASLLWAIKYNHVDITMDAIVKNYGQIQLSKLDDARIDNSGYAATLPEGMTIFDDNVDLARLAASGVNLNTIINPKTKKTLVSEMGLGLTPQQAQNRSLIHYQNELVMAVVKGEISKAKASKHLKVSIPANIAKNARVTFNEKFAPTITYPGMTSQEVKDTFESDLKTRVLASKKRSAKGISVFDFDDTLAKTKEKVIVYAPAFKPGTSQEVSMELTPAEFAERAIELEQMGASFDFSQFENVKGAEKGPLADLALKRQGKFGGGDIFVLTARPQASAPAIKMFLDGIGLNIPMENITGLENGSPQAKANWVLQKTGEGYNDFYFADDQMPNVKAVKQILDQVDVKSDVVIAKASKKRNLDTEFNTILEETTGLKAEAEYSPVRARLEGKKKDKGVFKWLGRQLTITPSAEDFLGLMQDLMGYSKQGNRHAKWIQDNLMGPYNKAEQQILSAKVTVANDFAALKKKFKSLRSTLKGNPLMDQIGVGPYTKSQAMRVYIWNKQGMEIPGISKRDQNALVAAVEADSELNVFADEVILIQKDKQYPAPTDNWAGGTIDSDIMSNIDKTFRRQVMTEFDENTKIIFSDKNMNKLEALYGKKWVDALKDSLRRMKSGSNRPVYQGGGARIVNEMLDWLNGSVGAVMFLNVKSGLLQLISNVNFINWGDNNIYQAAKAFASKEYWPTVMKLMNSDYLVNRRDGLRINVNEAELANAAKDGGMKGAIAYLLDKGFIITRIMDSLAIATGGATFYINRRDALLKRQNPETGKKYTQAEAEAKAFDDFYAISEESQQSSNPSKISQQQASLFGRVILAFQNVTMQYNRMTKKSIRDLYNRRKSPGQTQRESDLGNLSKIIYYTTIQNIIFNALQQTLFAALFDDEGEEKEKDKLAGVANGMADSLLFGLGFGGAAISTLKNVLLKVMEESDRKSPDYEEAVWEIFNVSPVLDSKVRKLRTTAKTFNWNMEEIKKRGWSLDNPTYLAISQLISAATNIPIDRVLRKIMNMRMAMDEETRTWQRVALMLGWSSWSVGLPYWGLQSTIKREEKAKEKAKNDYKYDIRKLKAQGYKKVMYRNLKDFDPKDIVEMQSPAGTVVYYVKTKKKKK